jgi:hypothetical protein
MLNTFTKSHAVTVLTTASQMNGSQVELSFANEQAGQNALSVNAMLLG